MSSRIILFFVIVYNSGCKSGINSLDSYRSKYKSAFQEDPRSPLKGSQLDSLDFYPYMKEWRLKNCDCDVGNDSQPFELPTYAGTSRTYKLYASAKCKHNSGFITFHIYKNLTQPFNPLYRDQLFLPFKDDTNGDETYGGGRYLNLSTLDIKNGTITIDLNKSYNPWCAYSDGYNCPIPPVANHLQIKVTAGEKKYKGMYQSKK